MPIITGMVPPGATAEDAAKIREKIIHVLENEGVSSDTVTIEFYTNPFPVRLVIYYFSRSRHLRRSCQRGREAEIIGKIFQSVFKMDVKCLVSILEESHTGVYVS